MEENNVEQNLVGTVSYFLYAVRRYLVLILAIIIVCVSAGVTFSLVRKPNYKATAKVVVSATLNGAGWSDETNWIQNHIKTIIDFCNSGVVVDRANYYYLQWEKVKYEGAEADLEDFIENPPAYQTNPEHNGMAYKIAPSNIDTAFVEHENSTSIVFDVSYTDKNQEDAKEKVSILLCACIEEVKIEDSKGEKVYFTADVNLKNNGIDSVEKDISTLSIVFVSGVMGVLLAVLVLYVLILLDNSIRSKEELEAIVGASMLATIQKNGGGEKNGK
ncbi:MAG: hypothetical protein E7348_01275 [Clostridiales bacterium]|nr:hypothetical protein [Clostridiales bacterium]